MWFPHLGLPVLAMSEICVAEICAAQDDILIKKIDLQVINAHHLVHAWRQHPAVMSWAAAKAERP